MKTYNVLDTRRNIVGTYPEYTKFARYQSCVTWVPLLVSENRVRFFALSTLEEVKAARVPFMTDMIFTCAEPPPLQGCDLPPPMHIFPMPDMYPKAVFLGMANYILERARGQVVINIAISDSQINQVKAA